MVIVSASVRLGESSIVDTCQASTLGVKRHSPAVWLIEKSTACSPARLPLRQMWCEIVMFHFWKLFDIPLRSVHVVHVAALNIGICMHLLLRKDYEILLRLDDAIPKKQATEEETSEALLAVACGEFMGKSCPICLMLYLETDAVAALPCCHDFHKECIGTWLSKYRKSCPLCCAEPESSAWCKSIRQRIVPEFDGLDFWWFWQGVKLLCYYHVLHFSSPWVLHPRSINHLKDSWLWRFEFPCGWHTGSCSIATYVHSQDEALKSLSLPILPIRAGGCPIAPSLLRQHPCVWAIFARSTAGD